MNAPKTGNTLSPGDVFEVAEERRGPDGILYLKLSDGRGWVFERKPGVGVLCERAQAQDLDMQGRHFINYSPALFLPLLDYLGMKEMEAAGQMVPLPRGPEKMRSEFEAMLRDFGLLASVGLGEQKVLSALAMPYNAVTWWAYGLAFEVRAKSRPVLITALETCAVARDGDSSQPIACTVHICEGPLENRLAQRQAWVEAGRGSLVHRQPSRIELTNSVQVRPDVNHCIYIATDCVGSGKGVSFGAPMPVGVSAENSDLQLFAGHFSTRFDDFSDGGWYPFNGKVEYMMALGT